MYSDSSDAFSPRPHASDTRPSSSNTLPAHGERGAHAAEQGVETIRITPGSSVHGAVEATAFPAVRGTHTFVHAANGGGVFSSSSSMT